MFLEYNPMGLLKRLWDLINKESPYEDEANGLICLIRLMLIIWMPVYLIMGICSICAGLGIKPTLIFFAGIIIYGIIFLETYRRRSRTCLRYLYVCATAISGLLTVVFGWRASFQNFVYIYFLLVWYDPINGKKSKMVTSTVIVVAMCVIAHLTPFGASIITPGTVLHAFVIYTNIVVFSISLSIVAYFFCNKHVESEHRLREYNSKLKTISETDPLTGLMNRRSAEEELEVIRKTSISQEFLFCIAIGDIDFFKNVNDTYGHDAGDFILASLASEFKEYMKARGFAARWGGEEFLFVIPRENGDEAKIILDDLRRRIKEKEFVYKDTPIKITMTFGLEEYSEHVGMEKTIAEADKKLYLGKQSGRDRVIF